MLFYFDEP
jgi:hypothetical protein